MAISENIIVALKDHYIMALLAFSACCLTYLYSTFKSKTPQAKNPFARDCRRPVKGLVHDRAARDKVIKQGFTRRKIPEDLDAIIIGSGIASLTTAALLGKSDKKVLVLEKHDQAGGCCHTFFADGFEFDAGVHYVGNCQLESRVQTILEQISEGQLEWTPLDKNFDTVVIDEPEGIKSYPLISGTEELPQSIVDMFPEEEEMIRKYFATTQKAVDAFVYYALLKVLPRRVCKWILRLRLLSIFTSYPKLANITAQEYVDSLTDNEHLKAVLLYIGIIIGMLPGDFSMLGHGVVVNHYTERTSYPKGGASEIAMNIIPVIEKCHGKVLVRATVTDIIIENGNAVGVRVEKGGDEIEIRAKMIISGCGIANTVKLLPEDAAATTGYPALMDEGLVEHGLAGICLFVGLNGTTESLDIPNTNIIVLNNPDWNGAFTEYLQKEPDWENPKDLPIFFISFQSAKDAAWEDRYPGKSACTVLTYVNYEWFQSWDNEKVKHRGPDYEAVKSSLANTLWKQVCKYYPQLEDKVEYFELGSPVTNNHYIGAAAGECFGLSHGKSRLSPEVSPLIRPDTGIPGLYITGKDIVFTGVAGGVDSGMLTTAVVLKRNVYKDLEKLQKQIRENETNCLPSTNGAARNGALTNGATRNGVLTNGVTKNGTSTNGVTKNGTSTNGVTKNGTSTNGVTKNGTSTNGITKNGTSTNGFTNNGTTTNGVTANGTSTNGLTKSKVH